MLAQKMVDSRQITKWGQNSTQMKKNVTVTMMWGPFFIEKTDTKTNIFDHIHVFYKDS